MCRLGALQRRQPCTSQQRRPAVVKCVCKDSGTQDSQPAPLAAPPPSSFRRPRCRRPPWRPGQRPGQPAPWRGAAAAARCLRRLWLRPQRPCRRLRHCCSNHSPPHSSLLPSTGRTLQAGGLAGRRAVRHAPGWRHAGEGAHLGEHLLSAVGWLWASQPCTQAHAGWGALARCGGKQPCAAGQPEQQWGDVQCTVEQEAKVWCTAGNARPT